MSGPELTAAERRARIAREIARRQAAASAARGIPRRPPGAPPVLSPAQERLWLIDRMHPGRSTYNASMTSRLEGPLDARALRRAVDTVVARHEAVRTVIAVGDAGRPQARLLPAEVGCDWLELDAPPDLDAYLRQEAASAFDLATDVMLRARLVRLGPDEHVLILVTHHIASDGWSRGPLFNEIRTAYGDLLDGREPDLPDLPIQYSDYAAWQRARDETEPAALTEFWRDEVAGADLVLDLPVDRSGSDRPTFLGERHAFEDAELGEAVRALGRSASATPFMAYLAVTATLLYAATGQTDFLLGSPSANRERPETAGLIGFFVETIILRVSVRGDEPFTEVLRHSREAVLRSLGHPLPLDRIVEAVRPKRLPGVNPLFQVNYRMQGAAPPPPQLRGLRVSRMFTPGGTSRFDLALGFSDTPGPLRGYFEYDAALFEVTTIESWTRALLDMLRAAVADPASTLDDLVSPVRDLLARRPAPSSLTAPLAPAAPARPSIRRIRTGA